MGWMHLLAHSAGVHSCHSLACKTLGASAADLAQQLAQPTPPTQESHIALKIAWEGLGKVTG
jgi:cytochrome c551/c552